MAHNPGRDSLSLGLSSLMSLLYITEIFHYAPALVLPALAIILLTVGVSVIAALLQIRISKRAMELGAKNEGLSFALINGVQKIKLAGAEKRVFARWARSYSVLPLEMNACLPGCVWNATPRSLSPLERNIGFWIQA